MAKAKLKDDEPTPESVAREVLDLCGDDLPKATKMLEQRVRSNQSLWFALTDPLIHAACYDTLRGLVRQNRAIIWTAPNYDKGGNGDRVRHLASANLMMFPLPGGLLLKDATRVDVSRAAEFYHKQASDMHNKARWLSLIAQHVTEDKCVGDVMTAERLRELQQEAANA